MGVQMKMTWSPAKRAQNLKKHGLDFEIAQYVFDDPYHLSEQDRIENYEYRWRIIGMVNSIVIMVGCNYEEEDGEETIRIITARKATSTERRQYHETQRF